VPSGFLDIDRLTSGFQPGNLVIVAARPSMGKSGLALCMAANIAVRRETPVALFTLEMSKSEVTQRLMCSEAKVESQRLRNGKLAADDWPRLTAACDKLAKAPIYVDDTGSITMMEIRSKGRRLKSKEPNLGLIVVDYIQLMTSGATVENRVQEVSQISRNLKVLARDLDVPVLALSQLSRAVEQRHDKRPILSDLRESGCLAGDSRVYLPDEGVYRPICELVGKTGFRVLAVDEETWKLEPRIVTNAFATGRKPVYRLTTRLGRTIRATGNHKFLAFGSWRRLDDMGPGMEIAAPCGLPGPETLAGARAGQAQFPEWVGVVRETSYRAPVPADTWQCAVRLVPAMADAVVTRGRLEPESVTVLEREVENEAAARLDWDEVVSIEPDGDDDVYDLTVEGLHSFVAEDIVVHNSIEQDADLVFFIYRDEYYNDETDQQGIAEIHLAKHRNGPTGTEKVAFMSRYAKFADLAAG
jgi:replicative DNA helicase